MNTTRREPYFVGDVCTKWLDDGRRMILEENFGFIDSRGKGWWAPAGSIVDGATIPRFFWRAIGGPYEGKYRNASVLHDVYCDPKHPHGRTRSYQDTHRMFLDAVLACGENRVIARLMYWQWPRSVRSGR